MERDGIFEVIKADTSTDESGEADAAKKDSNKSVLKVIVPPELEGMAYIQVRTLQTFPIDKTHSIQNNDAQKVILVLHKQ